MTSRRRTTVRASATAAATPTAIAKSVTDPIKDLFELPDNENPIYTIWNPPGLGEYDITIKKTNYKTQVIAKFNTLLKDMITENKTPILPEELMNMTVEEIRNYPDDEKFENTRELFKVRLRDLGLNLRHSIPDNLRYDVLQIISRPLRILTISSKPNYGYISHNIYKSLLRTDNVKFQQLITRFMNKLIQELEQHNSQHGVTPQPRRQYIRYSDSDSDGRGSQDMEDFTNAAADDIPFINTSVREIYEDSKPLKMFNVKKVKELTREFYINEAQNRASEEYDIYKTLENGKPLIKETPIKKYFKKLHLNKNAIITDFITRDDYSIEDVLKDPDYLLFVYRNPNTSKFAYFITTKDYIKNFIKDRSNIYYECLCGDKDTYGVIHPRTDVYFSSNSITAMTKALLKLSQMKTLLESNKRIFIMSKDDPQYDIKEIYKDENDYPTTRTEVKHIFSDIFFKGASSVSRTHCNEGKNDIPYDIYSLYYVNLNDIVLEDEDVIDAPVSPSRVYSDNMRRTRRSQNNKGVHNRKRSRSVRSLSGSNSTTSSRPLAKR